MKPKVYHQISYPEPVDSIPHLTIIYCSKINFNIIFASVPVSLKWPFVLTFCDQIVCTGLHLWTMLAQVVMLRPWLGHQPSWQALVVFLSLSTQMVGLCLKLYHHHFLPHSFQFISHCFPTIQHNVEWITDSTVHCSLFNLMQVFEAVMRWVKREPEVRKKDLPQLLAAVRMPLLTPHYLADRVSVEELIRTSHECR